MEIKTRLQLQVETEQSSINPDLPVHADRPSCSNSSV